MVPLTIRSQRGRVPQVAGAAPPHPLKTHPDGTIAPRETAVGDAYVSEQSVPQRMRRSDDRTVPDPERVIVSEWEPPLEVTAYVRDIVAGFPATSVASTVNVF